MYMFNLVSIWRFYVCVGNPARKEATTLFTVYILVNKLSCHRCREILFLNDTFLFCEGKSNTKTAV